MSAHFIATRKFDADSGDSWSNYIAWSGLTQLQEVVSLDGILCPGVIDVLIDEDWRHNVHEDNEVFFFRHLDYLRKRVEGENRVNILAIMQNPTAADIRHFSDSRFELCGFDLIDRLGSISALVNCGGFEKVFSNAELSTCGLLTDHLRATEVQRLLPQEYPSEHHADCDLWAIWRLKSN